MTVIDEKYKEALKRSQKNKKLVISIMICNFLFFTCMAIWNITLASKIGIKGGYDLDFLFHFWLQGVEPGESYDGIMLMATGRIVNAVVEIAIAILTALGTWLTYLFQRRNDWIIEVLKRHDEL